MLLRMGIFTKSKNVCLVKDYYKKEMTMCGYIGQNLLKELIGIMRSTKKEQKD